MAANISFVLPSNHSLLRPGQRSMANPWAIAVMTAVTAGILAVLSWFLNPTVSWILGKLFSNLSFDTPRRLRDLEIDTIPRLKEVLNGVENQRMVRSAEDEGSNANLVELDKIKADLRSALYEAEDILDLIDYHRIEQRVLSDDEQSIQQYLDAVGAFIAGCWGNWSGGFVDFFRTQLPEWAKRWCPKPLANCMRTLFSFVRCFWAWLAGIKVKKVSAAVHSLLAFIDRINLRKRIEHIEQIVNHSEKSSLLKQQSSSSSSNSGQEHVRIKRKVFGRDKERQDICAMLRQGPATSSSTTKPYYVIGIHGIAGSGKSTLAQYVCEYEEKQRNYFDPVMFIRVSTRFKPSDMFRDMLLKVDGSRSNDTNLTSLREELRGKLRGRRFLLVLDDLRDNTETRDMLKYLLYALGDGRSGSRILVTAQIKGATAALDAPVQEISMSNLDLEEEQYLTLFMHHALQDKVDHDGQFERTGRMIAKKLRRSPIAAVLVAQGLQNKDISEWKRTANLDVLNKTMGALWWSYVQLGMDIRRCFQFCSIFPRGYKLQRDKLVGMWIAQGFVKQSIASEDLEDVGQRYFDKLLTFSFLQEQPTTGLATEHFIIHDLLHELAERVAGTDFFRVDVNASPKDIPPDVHHVFIETYERAEIKDKHLELVNLRTLIIEEKFPTNRDLIDTNPKYVLPSIETISHERRDLAREKVFQSMFARLRKLRVLIVEVCCSEVLVFSVPASIGQMKHLRYLGFRTANILEMIFPSKFTKLYHMQILDCPYVELSCPTNMCNLMHLSHISGHMDFPNIGRLTALQMFPSPVYIVRREQGYELMQLKHLNKLRGTLEIYGLGIVGSKEEALEANLACKKRITELTLDFSNHDFDSNVEADVLEGLCPQEYLEKLHIWNYKGSRYPSWMLSRQNPDGPKYINLIEFNDCSQLVSIPEDSQFFNCLRSLEIACCDWDSLPENMVSLSKLHTLIITYCDNIQLLPNLPISLQRFQIMGRSSVLWKSCKDPNHINWEKIYHIGTKEFY